MKPTQEQLPIPSDRDINLAVAKKLGLTVVPSPNSTASQEYEDVIYIKSDKNGYSETKSVSYTRHPSDYMSIAIDNEIDINFLPTGFVRCGYKKTLKDLYITQSNYILKENIGRAISEAYLMMETK